MLHASGLPKNLWGEAVMHAVYLKNCTSTRTLKNKTPFEMLTGKKPNIANLCFVSSAPKYGSMTPLVVNLMVVLVLVTG
jgi:hypothetical protein